MAGEKINRNSAERELNSAELREQERKRGSQVIRAEIADLNKQIEKLEDELEVFEEKLNNADNQFNTMKPKRKHKAERMERDRKSTRLNSSHTS